MVHLLTDTKAGTSDFPEDQIVAAWAIIFEHECRCVCACVCSGKKNNTERVSIKLFLDK